LENGKRKVSIHQERFTKRFLEANDQLFPLSTANDYDESHPLISQSTLAPPITTTIRKEFTEAKPPSILPDTTIIEPTTFEPPSTHA
jgi:hypothetical protein